MTSKEIGPFVEEVKSDEQVGRPVGQIGQVGQVGHTDRFESEVQV